jgi:selenide,water dikinase
VLVLTKPLGTGIITTAIKRGLADPATIKRVISVMSELNQAAAQIMSRYPVNACTDVTGFGLLGHLKEMVMGSKVSAGINYETVPVITNSWDLAASGAIPGGTFNNLKYIADVVHWDSGVPELAKIILADAQTSGGLLVSIPSGFAGDFLLDLHRNGIKEAAIIGNIEPGPSFLRVKTVVAVL